MIRLVLQANLERPELLGRTESTLSNSATSPDNCHADETSPSNKKKNAIKQTQPRILIVDDNEAVRKALSKLLLRSVGWEPCGEAATGAEAIEKARELRPDVILLDITLPDFSGIEAARLICKEFPDSKILIVSQHDPAQMLSIAVAAGALGYVTKTNLARDLIPAIRALLESEHS
jgi:DNA-binding NarL/FixJ family response regulator